MIGKVTIRSVESQVIQATAEQLNAFTRQELRLYAKALNVERGQNKRNTITNLIESGKATLLAQLGN